MVFGSGSTWPQDFLFLTGFFSDSEVGAGGGGAVRAVCVSAVMPAASMERSEGRPEVTAGVRAGVRAGVTFEVMVGAGEGCESPHVEAAGDRTSSGLIVLAGDALNRDGYISSGAESIDSAGEPSNLTAGDGAPFQTGISDIVEVENCCHNGSEVGGGDGGCCRDPLLLGIEGARFPRASNL